MHTHLHTRTNTRRRHLFDVCVCVCALHNAGVKVSGLIFYLSGLITIAFTAALLRVRGGYSISAESLQGASEEEREKKKENTKLHVYNLYRESHKTLQLQTLPVLEVFYSLLPQCRKQQQQIPSVISDRADVSLLQSRCLFEKGKTRHKAFKWN